MASNWYHTCSLHFSSSRLAFISPRPEQFQAAFKHLFEDQSSWRRKVLILCLSFNPSIISRFGQNSRKHRHSRNKPFHVRLLIARRDNQALPPDYYSFLLPSDRAAVIAMVSFRRFVSSVYINCSLPADRIGTLDAFRWYSGSWSDISKSQGLKRKPENFLEPVSHIPLN